MHLFYAWNLCPAAVNGDVPRQNGVKESDGEGLVLGLAHAENSRAAVFAELPVVEAFGLTAVAALRLDFAADDVEPGFVIEVERIGGVLPLIHLRQIVF